MGKWKDEYVMVKRISPKRLFLSKIVRYTVLAKTQRREVFFIMKIFIEFLVDTNFKLQTTNHKPLTNISFSQSRKGFFIMTGLIEFGVLVSKIQCLKSNI